MRISIGACACAYVWTTDKTECTGHCKIRDRMDVCMYVSYVSVYVYMDRVLAVMLEK